MSTDKQKKRSLALRCGAMVRRLRALEKQWTKEAAGFHSMGRRAYRAGDMTGREYMAIGAQLRLCAAELKTAMASNGRDEGRAGND